MAAVAINHQVGVEVVLFCAYAAVWRFRLGICSTMFNGFMFCGLCLAPPTLLLVLADRLVVTLLATGHDAEQVVHAAAHVPFKKRPATLRINVQVLLIALDNQ